ncbi:MAG: hypothetical protein GY811_17405 [Myxococcales bacterium]|nr:hypothetical protein [Myxococcales bacterium]
MNAKSGLLLALISLCLLGGAQLAHGQEYEGDDTQEDSPASGESIASKHLSSQTADEAPSAAAGYKKGFFITDGGVNTVVINGRVQGRMEYTSVDEGGDARGRNHAFLVPRARLGMKGTAHTKRLSYKFESDFGKGQVALKDFFLDYRVGKGETRVRLGQFKMPFGRSTLTSSGKLEFVDRNIVESYAGNGRDIGITVHNNLAESPETEWAIGLFNGTGEKGLFEPSLAVDPATMETEVVGGTFSNVPERIRPAVAIRVGHNSKGMKGYSEADLEGGDLRYAVAGALLTHFHYSASAASLRAGVDFAVKQEGMAATGGVFADMQGAEISDISYTGLGAYVQAGYMLDKKKQVALRYASITEEGGNNQQEVGGVFSLYEFSHNLKWQTDISYLHRDDGAKRQDFRGRSQVQFGF